MKTTGYIIIVPPAVWEVISILALVAGFIFGIGGAEGNIAGWWAFPLSAVLFVAAVVGGRKAGMV